MGSKRLLQEITTRNNNKLNLYRAFHKLKAALQSRCRNMPEKQTNKKKKRLGIDRGEKMGLKAGLENCEGGVDFMGEGINK